MGKMQSMRDFSGGVMNQELQNRDDGRGIIISANNVVSSTNGELRSRTGTRLLTKLQYKSKLVPFRLPNGEDVVLLFSQRGDGADSTVGTVIGYSYDSGSLSRVYNIDSANVPEMPAPSSWTSNTNGDWRIASNSVATRLYNIFRTEFTPHKGSYVDTEHCFINYTDSSVPVTFDIINTQAQIVLKKIKFVFAGETSPNPSTAIPMYLNNPTIEYSDDGITWTPCQTFYEVESELKTGTIKIMHSSTTVYSFDSTVTINQAVEFVGHNYWRVSFANKVNISGNRITLIPYIEWLAPSGTSLFSANTNFGINDIDVLQFAQSENDLYVTSGTNKTPMCISYNNGTFTVSDFNPLDNGISIWQTHGNPGCVAVFQNRLCFAGFNAFRGRVIMSEFGDLDDFATQSPILSTSPIVADSLQLKSRIDFLWAGDKALYGLSAEGVSMIDAGGGVVATDQIEFQLRNREPAAGVLPTVKDDIMVYLGRDTKKILITDYDFIAQRYKTVTLSTKYNDFLQAGIKAIHYIPTKARLIYGILNDGNGFMMLFDQALEKNGIYLFSIGGNITDITPIKHKDDTKLLMVTSRNNEWTVLQKDPQFEKQIMDFMSDDEKEIYTKEFLQNNIFLDYYNTYNINGLLWFPLNISSIADAPQMVIDGKFIGNITPSTINLHVLKDSDNNKYHVKDIVDGEFVWTISPDTGLWQYYGALSVSGGTMSVNSIVVTDAETTVETLCYETASTVNSVSYGLPYNAYAVIKLATPYIVRKFPREIGVNFVNTGYLEIGNLFEDLRPVLENLAETFTISGKQILLNGNYEKTLDKQAFETPYIIVNSNKGLPFMITGIDYEVDYSNYQGGV